MKINRTHKNGTILEAIKNFDELTEEEFIALELASGDSAENYISFRIDRNKKGDITRAVGYEMKVKESTGDVADMFKNIEKSIEKDNLDRETAYAAAFNALDI